MTDDKCPYCPEGYITKTNKVVDGYPIVECSHCNTFGLEPVPGKEPPLRFIRRSLHEVGIELGMAK